MSRGSLERRPPRTCEVSTDSPLSFFLSTSRSATWLSAEVRFLEPELLSSPARSGERGYVPSSTIGWKGDAARTGRRIPAGEDVVLCKLVDDRSNLDVEAVPEDDWLACLL